MTFLSSLCGIAFAVVFTKLILNSLGKYRNAAKARQLGCLPPPCVPCPVWDPLALGRLRKIFQAAAAQKLPDYFVDREHEMSQKCGFHASTFSVPLLGARSIFTSDPKNIQAVLAIQFHDFELGPVRRGNFAPLLGTGIFTSDGKAWEHSRAMLRPNFARERVGALDLEHRHCQNLMRALPTNADGWTSKTDLQPLFFRLTLDSSSEFLFGESVNSQLAALPCEFGTADAKVDPGRREALFADAFDTSQYYLARRGRLGSRYWLINPPEFREACRQCHSFIDYYVQLALRQSPRACNAEKDATHEKEYVFLNELAQRTQDPIELRSQLLSILLAGRDTTASLLGWVFYFLARHELVFQKLRRAIVEDFGEYHNDQHTISFVSLKNCQYLQHCLNEVLRLVPIVPVNGRKSVKDTTLPRGGGPDGKSPVFVKKGTAVRYSVYVMQRNKEIWGQDADEFRPERWIGRKVGWEFLPFNGGPRVCIGQQFALTSAGFAVVRLLQRFDRVENLDSTTDIKHALTLTSCSGTGVQVRLHEAS